MNAYDVVCGWGRGSARLLSSGCYADVRFQFDWLNCCKAVHIFTGTSYALDRVADPPIGQ